MERETPLSLHEQAMDLFEKAWLGRKVRRDMELPEFRRLNRQAAALEISALRRFTGQPDAQRTRSVLYRSAATLCVLAGCPDTALRLVAEALADDIEPWVIPELEDVRDEAEWGGDFYPPRPRLLLGRKRPALFERFRKKFGNGLTGDQICNRN